MNFNLRWDLCLASFALGASMMVEAGAQSYPVKPVRLIVPALPGGVTDGKARAVANGLQPVLGQPIVIENRAGANSNIGTEACAKSVADGYTLCVLPGVVISINPLAYANLAFDIDRDFAPVIHLGVLDNAVAVHASVAASSMRELVELGKSRPGVLNWGSLGVGSNAHLYMEWFQMRTGARFTHVPYKGAPPLVQAITTGEVQITSLTPGTTAAHAKAGKLKVVAVVTSDKRSALMPEVPTMREQGFDLDMRNWNGIFAPSGTPAEAITRWNAETNKLVRDTAFSAKYFAPLGVSATGGTPEELTAFLKRDRALVAEVVKLAKIKLEQ